MSYSAPNRLLMPMRHSIDTMSDSWYMSVDPIASAGAWPSANLAIYVPLRIPSRVVVTKLWYSGGTTSTGNVDMALYDQSGVAVVTATAAAKGSDEQSFDVTDTTIGPGLYYIALASDSGTDTFYRNVPTAPILAAFGVLTEASAYPLPATATWSVAQTLAYLPLIGVYLGTLA